MAERCGLSCSVPDSAQISQSLTGNGSCKQRLMKALLIKHERGTEKPLKIEPWATNTGAPLPAFRLGGVREEEVTPRERPAGSP